MTRQCGDCQLCCKLLPVRPLAKPAGERCQHQKVGKGCTIYSTRPFVCRDWNCAWLSDPRTSELRRPDRSHYVVDGLLDFITIQSSDGQEQQLPCAQVWVDPAFKDAHRDPALRRYLAARNLPAIVRYNSKDGFVVLPPGLTSTGTWLEASSQFREQEHSLVEVATVLSKFADDQND